VQLPTLYVQSTEDYRIPAPAAERSFDALGANEKRFEWLTDCGHVITVDYCRKKVEELVTGWMEEHIERESQHQRLAGAAGERRLESAGGK
jgi:esterase/lipase